MQKDLQNFAQKNGTDTNAECRAVVRAEPYAEHRVDPHAVVHADVIAEVMGEYRQLRQPVFRVIAYGH